MMRYPVVIAALIWLTAVPATAEDVLPAAADDTEDGEVETNAFGYPDKSFVAMIKGGETGTAAPVNPKPDCNNPKLAAQVKEVLRPYIEAAGRYTPREQRKAYLALKNIDNFIPFSYDNTPKSGSLAARMVELKINRGLKDANITICRSDNPILNVRIYLVMYDEDDHVRIDAVNFNEKDIPTFVWNAD